MQLLPGVLILVFSCREASRVSASQHGGKRVEFIFPYSRGGTRPICDVWFRIYLTSVTYTIAALTASACIRTKGGGACIQRQLLTSSSCSS